VITVKGWIKGSMDVVSMAMWFIKCLVVRTGGIYPQWEASSEGSWEKSLSY